MSLRKEEIRNRFRKAGLRQGWWETTLPVVAAVSGGGDSVALLWMLRAFWPGRVIVAHLEHGIRGETSMRDADFVERLSGEWGLPVFVAHRQTLEEKRKGESLEDCARRLRYRFFEETLRETGAEWVLLGHNADDVAETMLFHLLRGTGLRGLVGIPERRDRYARPLVDFQRQELRAILRSQGVSWMEDETNADERYTRNFLRNRLIPLIREHVNPSAQRHLSALSREVAELVEEQDREARKSLEHVRTSFPLGKVVWSQAAARSLKTSVLARCIRLEGRDRRLPVLNREKTLALVDLVRRSGRWRFQWKEDIELCCGSGLIVWRQNQVTLKETIVPIDSPRGVFRWGEWLLRWKEVSDVSDDGMGGESQPLFETVLPFPLPEPLRIGDVSSGAADLQLPQIPWWAEKGWPVLRLGSTMSWSPDPGKPQREEPVPLARDRTLRICLEPYKGKQNGSERFR